MGNIAKEALLIGATAAMVLQEYFSPVICAPDCIGVDSLRRYKRLAVVDGEMVTTHD
jgi:hypothetical protein